MKRSRYYFIFIYLICFIIPAQNNYADIRAKDLVIIKKFPEEKDGVYLANGISFSKNENNIYFCENFSHQIIQFDLDGNYKRKIGNFGQGPGEFQRPHYSYVYLNNLYISDNGNARIQIFSLNGDYKDQIKIIIPIHGFVIVKDRIIIHRATKSDSGKNVTLLWTYDMSGELLRKSTGTLVSKYNDFLYDNSCYLRENENKIYLLQKYGTTCLVYDINGEFERAFNLELDPFSDKDYRKLNYKWAYTSFYIFDKKFFATRVNKGGILMYIFDMNGRCLERFESRQDENKIYRISDMAVIDRNNNQYYYLLLSEPDHEFFVAKHNNSKSGN